MRAWSRDVHAVLAAVLMTAALPPPPAPDLAATGEYPLKAALLYNFAKFVRWPEEAFPAKDTPLRVCVLGDDPFGDDLEASRPRKANGRLVVVQRGRSEETMSTCHIVFISASEAPRVSRILATFGPGVLTVSDLPRFAERGGIVGFIKERERIRFEINTDAAQRARLRISSKLLKLAKVIP